MACISHVCVLLCLFIAIRLAHAAFDLDRLDHDTLLTLRNQLTRNGQIHPAQETHSPCNFGNEILCEFILSKDNIYILRVTSIIIESQQLGGFLSPVIGRLSELKQLSLPNNSLVNQIPSDIADCQKLEILNLRNNQFSGPVPSQLSLLILLRELDLSSNMLTGNLDFLANLPNLQKLSLSNNLFTGKLPTSLQSFSKLGSLDISRNEFLGCRVPMNKNVVIPRYTFAESSIGNQKSAAKMPRPREVKISKKKKVIERIYGFLAGAIAGIVAVLVFLAIVVNIKALRKRAIVVNTKPNLSSSEIQLSQKSRDRDRNALETPEVIGRGYSAEIKLTQSARERAQNFTFLMKKNALETLEVIGRGNSAVYRYKQYAIKRVQISNRKDEIKLLEDFRKLEKIRHRNILPPIALVSHRPTKSDYLVISYLMENGSLHDMLIQVREGTRELDWEARYRIAVGVAEGLEYLHTSSDPRLIHRDIKPANILLDDNMEARIADFENFVVVRENRPYVKVNNVRGTFGFMAPECYTSPLLTETYDVFSFGVLLGVLVTGKFPSDEMFREYATGERSSLVGWARYVMTYEDPVMAIDPHLRNNGFEEQMFLVLKIACLCILENPRLRPNSKDVKGMLSRVPGNIVT